jgi:hypothetical protein
MDPRIALNVDVTVTIAAAAHAPTDTVEGMSLLGADRRRGFVLEAASARSPGGNGTNVTRPASAGGARSASCTSDTPTDGSIELYDYAKDLFELTDRHEARSLAGVRHRLRHRVRRACAPPPPRYHWR